MTTEKKNIYQRIQAVAQEIKGIDKDMAVGSGSASYKAVSDLNVTMKVKEAEAKHGIISIPIKQDLLKSEVLTSPPDQYGKSKVTFVETIKMTLRIVNIDDPADFVEVESFGRGIDAQDKGFGKASTYARKYALLNAYKIATGVDPDAELSQQMEVAATADIRKLKVENYALANDEFRNKLFMHFGIGELSELTEQQYTTIYNDLLKKGRIE